MAESCERPLKRLGGFALRAARDCFRASLPVQADRLLPLLTAQRMLREPLHLLGEAVSVQALHGFRDSGVEVAAPVVEEAPIGHLMRKRVLEGEFQVGKEARLIEELGRLEVAQRATERLLVLVRDSLKEGKGEILTDGSRYLEEPFLLGQQPVDARSQDGLDRCGHLHRLDWLGQPVGTPPAEQRPRLDHRAYTLLDEKRITPGLAGKQGLERIERSVGSEQGIEQFAGGLRREHVEAQLRVERLVAPAVAVFGTIVDKKQQAYDRKALDKTVEERLRLGVDPVEILEDHKERLNLRLPE
ncbi:MAG TPA: hypothetical protein VGA23_01790 [Methylomirabilota bacterium]